MLPQVVPSGSALVGFRCCSLFAVSLWGNLINVWGPKWIGAGEWALNISFLLSPLCFCWLAFTLAHLFHPCSRAEINHVFRISPSLSRTRVHTHTHTRTHTQIQCALSELHGAILDLGDSHSWTNSANKRNDLPTAGPEFSPLTWNLNLIVEIYVCCSI